MQLYRSSGDVGIFRALFVLLLILPLLILFLIQRIGIHPWPMVVPSVAGLIIWVIHSRRKDYKFLKSLIKHTRVLFFTEYLIFTSPLIILMLSKGLVYQTLAFSLLLALIAIAAPTATTLTSHTIKLRMIPVGMFEWQSGIRKNLGAFVVFYFAGLFGFFHPLFSAVAALLITALFISFYSEYEPRNMICATRYTSREFLLLKLATHAGYFALILMPLLFIALIHPGYRLITLGYFLAAINLMVFSILLKYYHYRPGAYSGAHQLLVTLAAMVCVLLPMALLIFVLNLFLAFGALANLKRFLDDRN